MSKLAKKLINENKRTRSRFLDLGNCDLTEIPAEVGHTDVARVAVAGWFFLTKRSLYLLLDDTCKDQESVSDEGFKYWLALIDLRSP
jgi:hypothetical protein